MKMAKKIFWTCCVLFIGSNFYAQNKDLFDEATNFYAEGQYEQAAQNYEQILEEGKASVEVYYNLGNAYYKMDQVGPSIYYYNKALQIDPSNKDVQNNLLFAQEKTVDVIQEVPQTGWNNFIDNLISAFDFNTWAVWSIVFAIAFMVFGSCYYFAARTGVKRIFFMLGGIAIIACVLSLVFAFQQQSIQQSKRFAIVFDQEAKVYAEPNHNSAEAFTLHEGTKLKVLDNFRGYSQIKLADDSRGWISDESIKEL